MPRQGIAWGPIAFVVVVLMTSISLIAWGLIYAPENATSNSQNPVGVSIKSQS